MSIFTTQPAQVVSESEKTKDWYGNNVRFMMASYNRLNWRLNGAGVTDINERKRPITEIRENYAYYHGLQSSQNDYAYTITGTDNCEIPHTWVRGQKIAQIVDSLVGKALDIIDNIEPSCKLTSKDAINRKTDLFEKLSLLQEAPELFSQMQDDGIQFQPAGPQQFETPQDIDKFMETTWKERGEIIAMSLMEDVVERNALRLKYKQFFQYVLAGGYCGIENRVENGKEYCEVVSPDRIIIDRAIDSDFNEKARFVAKIEYLSPSDIIERFQGQLTSAEIEDIKKITTSNIGQILGLIGNPFAMAWSFTQGDVPIIAALTGYWIGMKNLRYENSKDKFGNEHLSRVRNNRKTDYWTKTVYKCTLIGNKYIVNHGEDTNIVRSQDNPGDVVLPLQVYIPNMMSGENRSIISRLRQHQDRIDFIVSEQTKMITRAKGKVYVINKQKLGSVTNAAFVDDLTRMGVHVSDGNFTGEEYVPGMEQRVVEMIDWTLDPNIQLLVSLRQEEERIMEEIASLSKIALGQQAGYVGAKTQAGTIAQSNLGTASLFRGFINFVERHLRHAVNQYKVSLIAESEDEIPVVGTKGKNWLKITKDFMFEELGIYIKIKDFIDDDMRSRLLANAQAFAQNQQISPLELIKMESCKTLAELTEFFEYTLSKRERKAEEQQAMMAMQQQAAQMQQQQGQMQLETMRQQGENERTSAKLGADMVTQPQM